MRRSATPDTKNHTHKKHPLDVAKKYLETYFSSNAVAQNPEERVQMNITGNRDSLNFKYEQNK